MPGADSVHGAYIGAAIGDAMGAPVETNHAARIRRLVGDVDDLLPHDDPYTIVDHTGYEVREEAGAVTDDTFIRSDLTRFYLDTEPPRSPEQLAEWLLDHADFEGWFDPAIENVELVVDGEDPVEVGWEYETDGINGWWTPIGIRNAGDPDAAAKETKRLSTVWKAPVQGDLVAAVQAGLAEAFREEATYETVVEAMRASTESLPRTLIDRAVTIGEEAPTFDALVDELYERALFPEPDSRKEAPQELDAPLPSPHRPVPYTDERYVGHYNHEQVPLAVAGFVFSEGAPEASICTTVNIGRDCDSTATSVGSWVGALHGESALPDEWVDTVCAVNEEDVDIRGLADSLLASEVGD